MEVDGQLAIAAALPKAPGAALHAAIFPLPEQFVLATPPGSSRGEAPAGTPARTFATPVNNNVRVAMEDRVAATQYGPQRLRRVLVEAPARIFDDEQRYENLRLELNRTVAFSRTA